MRALFLDRDGVINKDYGHVHSKENFEFKEGIFELTESALASGYSIFVITNQAGIAKGYYTEKEFQLFTQWIDKQFQAHNIKITKTYYCPHHPDYGNEQYRRICRCRKPGSELFERAVTDFSIDMRKSIMIGDKLSDIEAAKDAGVGRLILLDNDINVSNDIYEVYKDLQEIRANI